MNQYTRPARTATTLGVSFGALALAASLAACGPQNGEPVVPPATVATTAVAPTAAAVQPVPVVPAPQPQPQPQPVQVAQAQPVAPPPVYEQPRPRPRAVASANLGEVRSINEIRSRPKGSGTGAVVGGVVGGLLGNQLGGGSGRVATTVVGAAGGAVVGNNLERNHNTVVTGYRVNVRLDNGQSRTFEERRLDGLQVGDRVRIENGRLRRG